MHKVYYPNSFDHSIQLNEEESKHAIRVMRLQSGDQLMVLDGHGTKYTAEITHAHAKRCELSVLDKEFKSARTSFQLTVAIAPTKNLSRMEWFVEKATEIGIDKIVPIISYQSERKVLKTERLKKIAISAMKQSGQFFLPQIEQAIALGEFLKTAQPGFIAHCNDINHTPQLLEAWDGKQDLTILIGPEGDFTPEEVTLALEKGFKPVALGSSILRTETAGIVACTLANSK